jgi:biopolymer transport protein ExbB
MESGLGLAHFIAQTDTVGRCVLALLLVMSVASWYLIFTKAAQDVLTRRRGQAFLKRFWQSESIDEAASLLATGTPDNAFAALASEACSAARKSRSGKQSLAAAGGLNEYLTRVLRNEIDQETARAEHGLTVLASAGSAAPYVGLFGTVWGIYHALVQIGMSGQGTLDKVAGPVGEALIMTAVGLAVAIPAVLAYNFFTRRNRVWLASLDGFAHDLITLLTVASEETGAAAQGSVRALRAAVKSVR